VSCEIERLGGLGGPVVVGVPSGAVSPGGGALYSGGSSYPARFPVLPGAQGLAQTPAQIQQGMDIAKQAGLDIPGVDQIMQQLGAQIPGLPVSPGMIQGLVTGDIQVEDVVREGAFALSNALVPGMGVVLSAVWPQIEQLGGAAIDVITGQKEKRDRRRRNWRGIKAVFNYTMDMYPLAIYKTGNIPSPDFLQLFQRNMNDPNVWKQVYYKGKEAKIPYWVHSGTALKRDYEGSNISGKRTGVTYFDRAQWPREILKMMKKYYELPGKEERKLDAIRRQVELAKEAAQKKAKPVTPPGPPPAPLEERQIEQDMLKVIGGLFKQKPELATQGAKLYIPDMIAWLNLSKKYNPATIAKVVPEKINAVAKEYLRQNPQVLQQLFQAATKQQAGQQQQQAQTVTRAAAQPGTPVARQITQALGNKSAELQKLAQQRERNVQIAQRQAQSFRADLRKLQQKFAAAKTPQQKAQVRSQMDALAGEYRRAMQAAASGQELARNAATQQAIARKLTSAVATGQPQKTAQLTRAYNRLGRDNLRQKILQRFRSRRAA
jgi:hypothetical protein